jgi:hypothetical protein
MSHLHHREVDFGRAFAIGVLLNSSFIVAEVVFGLPQRFPYSAR